MNNKNRSLSPGFTLVELLVVIAIIAVLAAISVTMVFRFRKSGDKVVATNNLKQLQVANMSYAVENGGSFVPPSETIESVDYQWFENPVFISQIKGISATYLASGSVDTDLELSLMDPVVVRARATGYDKLDSSYGYTTPESGGSYRQAQLEDPARSAVFITADAAFADYGSKSNIAYRHLDKAIVVYYDGHASPITLVEIEAKPETDIFWTPVPAVPTP